nr:hypothetical protein [Tanacetum cinerariifolium]
DPGVLLHPSDGEAWKHFDRTHPSFVAKTKEYELIGLWKDGVETYDAFKKQNFRLKATLMWTVNDFLAYGMLSGSSTHGKLSCPYSDNESDMQEVEIEQLTYLREEEEEEIEEEDEEEESEDNNEADAYTDDDDF